MTSLDDLISGYVVYNPKRVYSLNDYIIRYHSSYRSLCRLKCIKAGATGVYNSDDWEVVECAVTGFDSPVYLRAPYLGACATNIVYGTRKNPERFVPPLPTHQDDLFDNITFIA